MPIVAKKAVLFLMALCIGLSLFALMEFMISTDATLEQSDSERVFLSFVRVQPDENLQTKERTPPQEPPPPEAPPETPDLTNQMTNMNASLDMNMPSIGIPINTGDGPFLGALQQGGGMAGFDTDVIPVVRVPPTYPRNARQANIEGYVTMAVTINPDGSVSSVEVLEAQPPRLFDQAAMDAMSRWKFRPKIVSGNPVSQRARQTIEFKLGGQQ